MHPERRARRRFPIHVPILISGSPRVGEIRGFTRDISSAGVFFHVDDWPLKDPAIEFKMMSPAEITTDLPLSLATLLTEGTRAVCRGRVVRVEAGPKRAKTGVAATIDSYDASQS
jgi:hypothetical protein